MLLILTYSLLQMTYCLWLVEKLDHVEEAIITIEQLIMLLVVFRTLFYQYYKTAYNIKLFTAETLMLKEELKLVDLLSEIKDSSFPHETAIMTVVFIFFVCYSLLVGLTHTWIQEPVVSEYLSIVVLIFTTTVYSLAIYYFS